jgi:protein TonB
MTPDRAEPAIQAAAAALTAGLIALAVLAPIYPPPTLPEAPKPAQVTLSMVEEPPPPPPQPAPPPEPEPPPPPPQVAPSPLPPPPPPRPRHIVRPRTPPPLRRVEQPDTPPPPTTQPQSEAAPRPTVQAPENHSAEAAYVGRLHAIVERHTAPPDSPAYRLSHPSGEVVIAFSLSRGGDVSNVRVLRSSGSAILDRQALQIVAGQRYPAMPADVFAGAASHPFTVPVTFLPSTGAAEGL